MQKLASFLANLKVQLSFSQKQAVILFLLALMLLLSSLFVWFNSQPQEITITSRPKAVKRQKQPPSELLFVHVAGEVKNPGVYKLKKGSRLITAIKAAGGETTNANLNALNLAAKLSDGQQVLVPAKNNSLTPITSEKLPIKNVPNESSKLNVNTATQAELEAINGIGPVTAKKIIAMREKLGGFKSINQLDEIDGIGPKKFARLKEELAVY